MDASEICPRRIGVAKRPEPRVSDSKPSQNKRWTHTPSRRWCSKIVRKRLRIPRTHSGAGTNRKERRSQWRTSRQLGKMSTDRINRWRWSPCRLLVDSGWLHRSFITMNLEFNSMCRRKKHSQFHWNTLMLQGQHILIWTSCKRNVSMTVGVSIRAEACPICGKVSQNSFYCKKSLPRDFCGLGGDWQKFRRLPDQIGQKYGPRLVKPLRIEKNKNGKTRSQNSTMLEDWEAFASLILMTRITKKLIKNVKRKLERPVASAMPCKRKAQTGTTKVVCNARKCTVVWWKLMNPRGNEESSPPTKHEDHIAGKGFTSQKLQWTRNGRRSRQSQRGNWKSRE